MDAAVINAAAKSTLGILAIMVILVSGIALAFFRRDSPKVRVPIFLLLLAGVAAFATAVMLRDDHRDPGPPPTTNDTRAPDNQISEVETAPAPPSCRTAENGVETDAQVTQFKADSGWRGGGSSPDQFCAGELSVQRAKLPAEETISLERTEEDSRDDRPPFNVRRYLYTCTFTRRSPVKYRYAPNPACARPTSSPAATQINVTANGEGSKAIGQVNGPVTIK